MAISSDDAVRTGGSAALRGRDAGPVRGLGIGGGRMSAGVLDEQEPPPLPNASVADKRADVFDHKAFAERVNVEQVLGPLRVRRVTQATERGARVGATLGTVIGGVIGTFLIPVPGVGTAVGMAIGALAGGAGGGTAGWLVAERRAGQMTPESVAGDYRPGSRTFDARMHAAGHDPGSLSDDAKARISERLQEILSSRAKRGRPFTREFVKGVQSALVRLETLPDLSEPARRFFNLEGGAAESDEIDAAMVERAVENLARGRQQMPGLINDPKSVTHAQRQRVVAALDAVMLERARRNLEDEAPDFALAAGDAFRYVATSDLDADVEKVVIEQLHALMTRRRSLRPYALEAAAIALVKAGRELHAGVRAVAMQTLTAAIGHRQGQAVGRDFAEKAAQACIDAFLTIAESGLDRRFQDAAAAQLRDIVARGENLEPAVLPVMAGALCKIAEQGRDPDWRGAAMQSLAIAIDERLRWQRPVDASFLQRATQACIDAEQTLREARWDANQRRAIRDSYRAAVAAAISDDKPLTAEQRGDLLRELVAIQQASDLSDEARAAAMKTFQLRVDQRLYRDRRVDLAEARDFALEQERVLAGLEQEKDLPAGSVAALKQACRQHMSGLAAWRAGARHFANNKRLRDSLLPVVKVRMTWRWPENEQAIARLGTEADDAIARLVANPASMSGLRRAYVASARHTMALRARGRALDGTADPAGPRRSFEPEEIRKDLEIRIRNALKDVTPEQALATYRDLMRQPGVNQLGERGKARAYLVAADMFGASHVLRTLDPDGVQACQEVLGGLLAAVVTAFGNKAGVRPEDDIRDLHEATARIFGRDGSFDPDAPQLANHDLTALELDQTDGALAKAKEDVFRGWWVMLDFICLRELAAADRNPDAAAPPPSQPARGPAALAMPGADAAIADQGDEHDSGNESDEKDDFKVEVQG